MRVVTYEMRRDKETELPMLVKESSCNYPALYSATTPEDIWRLMCGVFDLGNAIEEYTYALAYDNKLKLVGVFMLTKGTQEVSQIGIKEMMSRLLMIRASKCVFIHNHPSGDPTPSAEDIATTTKIKAVCDLMGIHLVDHVIVAENGYMSFYAHKISPFN